MHLSDLNPNKNHSDFMSSQQKGISFGICILSDRLSSLQERCLHLSEHPVNGNNQLPRFLASQHCSVFLRCCTSSVVSVLFDTEIIR